MLLATSIFGGLLENALRGLDRKVESRPTSATAQLMARRLRKPDRNILYGGHFRLPVAYRAEPIVVLTPATLAIRWRDALPVS